MCLLFVYGVHERMHSCTHDVAVVSNHAAKSQPPRGGCQQLAHPTARQVVVHTINPLALSVDELYGSFEAATHEWRDGVLAKVMRAACRWGWPRDRRWAHGNLCSVLTSSIGCAS